MKSHIIALSLLHLYFNIHMNKKQLQEVFVTADEDKDGKISAD